MVNNGVGSLELVGRKGEALICHARVYKARENLRGVTKGAQAVDLIKQAGGTGARMVCVVAAPEGMKLMEEQHPEVDVYTAALDEGLNDRAFIVPGLGDFGDRLFGTG